MIFTSEILFLSEINDWILRLVFILIKYNL